MRMTVARGRGHNPGESLGIVYLLHFDSRYKHAGHYIGFVESDLKQRISEHERGLGANLVRVVRAAGIDFSLARTHRDAAKAL
jgi:predicted GIY-YIG superfamily endonuclease